MSELTDRVKFCVVKANCAGPSILRETQYGATNGDRWECRSCTGYVVYPKGQLPEQDQRRDYANYSR